VKESKLISVVVPLYNSCNTIERTIKSVLTQSYQNLEVMVVDDGSEDNSRAVIEKMADSRIHYYCLPHQNANVARNYGINHSRGEYIAMLDADDEWLANHLEDSLTVLQERKADCVYGSLILRGKFDRVIFTRALESGESIVDFLLTTGYGAQTSTLVMTASSAKDVLWNESLRRHQDYDFVVRYGRKYRLYPKLEPTVVYYLSDVPKVIDFDSCIRFICTVEDEITDSVYMDYHRRMLGLAMARAASEGVIWHYRRAAAHYKYLLSFHDYLLLLQPRSKFEVWSLMMRYIWGIFRSI